MSDTVATAPASLAQDQLVELLGLVQDADGVELKGTPAGYERKLVIELWLYPGGDRILERSTKCPPSEAFQVAVETRAFLGGLGITPAASQQTKARKALSFFSEKLKEAVDAV